MQTIKSSTLLDNNKIDGFTNSIIEEAYKAFIGGDYEMGDALMKYVNSRCLKGGLRIDWDFRERLFDLSKPKKWRRRQGR